jgi:hypothetical protein
MALDSAQLVTLGNDIRANVAVNGDLNNFNAIRAWYNADASPSFHVFKSSVSTDVARKAVDWSEVLDDVTPLKDIARWSFDQLLANGDYDAGSESNRDALAAIFAGTNYQNTRAAILAASVRLATEAEKLFAVTATGPAGGDGSSNTAAAALVYEGQLTNREVNLALEATA